MEQRATRRDNEWESGPLKIRRICAKNGVFLSDDQLARLEEFVSLLLEQNSQLNLISRQDVGNVWLSHVLHSLSLMFRVVISQGQRLLDLGTGGGLPGIPLKIARPDLKICLLDATKKKTEATRHILDRLKLQEVGMVWGRAEEVGQLDGHRGSYDIVVARAVAPLFKLVRWSFPLMDLRQREKPCDVMLLAYKGGNVEQEVRRIQRVPFVESVEIVPLVFPGAEELEDSDKKIVRVTFRRQRQEKP